MNKGYKGRMLPHNLILTYARCDYCEKQDQKQALIYDDFGIKTCDDHYELGKRDCDSYLYLNNMIHLQDVKQLVDALPETFSVKRTSGEMQDGWSVDLNNPYLKKVDGEWHVPCINREYNLTKKPSLQNMTHLIDKELIENIINQVELEKKSKHIPAAVKEYKEHPCVQRAVVDRAECNV